LQEAEKLVLGEQQWRDVRQ